MPSPAVRLPLDSGHSAADLWLMLWHGFDDGDDGTF
jgi:hypothetical protein